MGSCKKWMSAERNSDTHVPFHLDPLKRLFLKVIIPRPGKDGRSHLQREGLSQEFVSECRQVGAKTLVREQCSFYSCSASRSGLDPTALGVEGAGHPTHSLGLLHGSLPPFWVQITIVVGLSTGTEDKEGNSPGDLGNEKLDERKRKT